MKVEGTDVAPNVPENTNGVRIMHLIVRKWPTRNRGQRTRLVEPPPEDLLVRPAQIRDGLMEHEAALAAATRCECKVFDGHRHLALCKHAAVDSHAEADVGRGVRDDVPEAHFPPRELRERRRWDGMAIRAAPREGE